MIKLYSFNSLLNNNWNISDCDERESLMIAQRHNISPLLAKLLNIRKISSDYIDQFLKPEFTNYLPDPFKLKDMKKSIERIILSIEKNELIGIIADYDVDGATSAAILCKFFKSINQKYILKIPDRLKEGYGPNERILNEFLSENINLLITLDCGTTAFDIFNQKKYSSLDSIIIDHHISENEFPKVFSIVNPNRFDENNDYRDFAAVGVTYLLLMALRKELRNKDFFKNNNFKEPNLLNFLDLVALGTVCDVVSLHNYNRVFVSKGLEILHKRNNKALTSIVDNSRINHPPAVTDLSYVIGPQLNAASRIENSLLSSKLLISDDIIEIESISRKLLILNEKRKLIENQVFEEAYNQAIKEKNNNVIIVNGVNWHKGVLGIVASRLVEFFNKPSIVISFENNFGVGSARSIHSIDLGKIIIEAKNNNLILSGGGHKMAAGLRINKNKISEFKDYIIKIFNNFDNSYFKKNLNFDSILSLEEINKDLLRDLNHLEPFGKNNPEPMFIIQKVEIEFAKIIKNKHVLINLKNISNDLIKAICFNCFDNKLGQNLIKNKSNTYDLGCSIKNDIYQGNITPQLIIHDAIVVD